MRSKTLVLCKSFAVLAVFLLLSGCATMKFALFGVSVQAVDETEAPIAGAIVTTSDGQQVTTDAHGIAQLKFASVGMQMITVQAQNRPPVTFKVTMPLDVGKTIPAHFAAKLAEGAPTLTSDGASDMGGSVPVSRHRAGGAMAGNYMAAMYPVIFQSMFTAYGYNMNMGPYGRGQWTEWNYSGKDKGDSSMVLQKAFLTKLENGQEWWQVTLSGLGEKNEKMAFEVLFSAERQSIRRMRQQMPGGTPSEVPVTEGWYSAPMQLTPESLEGATTQKGVEVKVPAGAFKCDLLEFSYMGAAKVRMWRANQVPGGLVRVELSHDEDPVWVSELKAYGNGAKSILGSY